MITAAAIIGMSILVAVAGIGLYFYERKRQRAAQALRLARFEAFIEEEQQRLKANTASVMREIGDLMKQKHPEATRQSRRAVATRYRSTVNSA